MSHRDHPFQVFCVMKQWVTGHPLVTTRCGGIKESQKPGCAGKLDDTKRLMSVPISH
jgi:hypothetical protein